MAGNDSNDDWKPASARQLDDDWKPPSARAIDDVPVVAKYAPPPSIGSTSSAEQMRSAYLWAQSHKGDPRAADILKFVNTPVSVSAGSIPTLDAANTGAFHFARHLSFGLGDKIIAAEQASRDFAMNPKTKFGDAYNRNLKFNDSLLEASDVEHPVARWTGNALGAAGSLAGAALAAPAPVASAAPQLAAQGARLAPTLAQLARQGAEAGAVLGGVGGYGASRSDSALGALGNTAAGAALGAGLGAATPYAASGAGKYLGNAARYLSDKTEDFAGYLKLHSLHPTPTLSEKMADIPGGEIGVGKELLERGLGGLTKKSTASQIEVAKEVAGKGITKLAKLHDASGGPGVVLNDAIDVGHEVAAKLQAEPTTEAAGNRLADMMGKYAAKYAGKSIPATEALALKRTVAKAAYGAGDQLKKTGDTIAGEFGAGLSKFERAIDEALDKHLGPDFETANLAYRRLLGAGQAAERSAARTQGNAHLIGGLVPTLVGGSAMAAGHGGPEALALGLGSSLLQKYGSQVGARLLYSPVAGGLNLADYALAQGARPGLSSVLSAAASSQAGQTAGRK